MTSLVALHAENERLKAEVEGYRKHKVHAASTAEIVRALNDRAALVERVVEACARAADDFGVAASTVDKRQVSKLIAGAIRSLDRAKLLSEEP